MGSQLLPPGSISATASGNEMVFFEVMEINGRYEAVKMLLPTMIEENMGDETWSNEI